jgi:hypothetical protein
MHRAGIGAPDGLTSWQAALAGRLDLFFEVNLPSPTAYRTWLRKRLDERVPVPYLREAAERSGERLEGATKVDAMLLAADTGVAVVFEAKVLSDISTTVQFDVARNQMARIIDVTLDENPGLMDPLKRRNPRRTCTVLLTPRLFHRESPVAGLARSRLYGWLVPEYQRPGNDLLRQHLVHRDEAELDGVEARLGWGTWEDVNDVLPGACPWLPGGHPPVVTCAAGNPG